MTTPSAAGQYSVNLATGIYTFAAADAGAAVSISYLYTASGGKKLVLTNQFMGYTPVFKATFYTTKTTQNVPAGLSLVLNACTATKLVAADQDRRLRDPGIRLQRLCRRDRHDRHVEHQRMTESGAVAWRGATSRSAR